jgi:ribonuclease HI
VTSNRNPEINDWIRMWFKTNKVWMAVDGSGNPITKNGKVLIKYQLKQDYEYWVNRSNVRPLDSPPPGSVSRAKRKKRNRKRSKSGAPADSNCWKEADVEGKICVFTDGAAAGNPGPAGIGVLLRYGKHEKKISKYIGTATNNIAELKAILAGLTAVKDPSKPVRLFTDSQYAFGLLVKNWKAHKNREIVDAIRKAMTRFKDLKIIKVKGHSGNEGNEMADRLATSAIKKARSN